MWPFSSYPERTLADIDTSYDYIIVGGGTAGAVLANRLSIDKLHKVLLVERGPLADSWASHVPLLSSDFASNGSRSSIVPSTYQKELGRPLQLYTGSALGGGSRINQMLYTRGVPAEYDAWRDAGNPGWGWSDMKPYFLKSEYALSPGDRDSHGILGEWSTQAPSSLAFPGFYRVVEASRAIGLPYIDDVNSTLHPPVGCARLHYTRGKNQHRSSTYHAFLPGHLARARAGNLHILTNTLVDKLATKTSTNGLVSVVGISIRSRDGSQSKYVSVEKEVILSAGPLVSPKILMLSGIGPAEHLKEHDITVVKDLPAVGQNLEDHFGVSIACEVPMSDSLMKLEKRPWIFVIELLRYLLFGTGLLLAPVLQLAIFGSSSFLDARGKPIRSKAVSDNTIPDLEIMPMAYDSNDYPEKSRGMFSFLNVLLHPKSKGTIHLSSNDPDASLIIDPRYLTHPDDLTVLRASLRLSLRLRDEMQEAGYRIKNWDVPEDEDNATLDAFIRRRNRTTYHYSSTCRMAPNEAEGAVDEQLRVYGVEKLRVADSSIFPWVLGTHLQAPTVAVAEKCADMILKGSSKKE